jgi:hypothetical protein
MVARRPCARSCISTWTRSTHQWNSAMIPDSAANPSSLRGGGIGPSFARLRMKHENSACAPRCPGFALNACARMRCFCRRISRATELSRARCMKFSGVIPTGSNPCHSTKRTSTFRRTGPDSSARDSRANPHGTELDSFCWCSSQQISCEDCVRLEETGRQIQNELPISRKRTLH